MAVKIRLMRIGTTGRPFFRVVAVDERKKRTGEYLELLGTYNPLSEPKEIILKQDRIDAWMKQGAQPSTGFLRIIGKAPQRPARKPKKAQPETPAAPAPVAEQTPAEESAAETVTPTEEISVQTETSEAVAPSEEAPTETGEAASTEEEQSAEETPAEG